MNLFKYLEKLFGIDGHSADEGRKRAFLSFGIIICLPFVTFFAINDLKNNRIYEGLFILLFLVVLLFVLFALKSIKNMKILYRFSGISVLLLLSYELAIGGGEGRAFLWFYFFPIAAFYLAGKKEGLFWVTMSVLISGFFFLHPIFFEYDSATVSRFLITYSIVCLLSFSLELSRHRYYRQLMREKKMLEDALNELETLQGLLPICSFCKSIRDDKGYWNQIESYIRDHSKATFSHSICPECSRKYYPEFSKDKDTND